MAEVHIREICYQNHWPVELKDEKRFYFFGPAWLKLESGAFVSINPNRN